MKKKKQKSKNYQPPSTIIVEVESSYMLAMSGDVTVGGWGNGGNIGGGEADEGAPSRRGEWGDLWK